MYENIDDIEKQFNSKMDILKDRINEAEEYARDLIEDSIWEEDDKKEVRDKFFNVMLRSGGLQRAGHLSAKQRVQQRKFVWRAPPPLP